MVSFRGCLIWTEEGITLFPRKTLFGWGEISKLLVQWMNSLLKTHWNHQGELTTYFGFAASSPPSNHNINYHEPWLNHIFPTFSQHFPKSFPVLKLLCKWDEPPSRVINPLLSSNNPNKYLLLTIVDPLLSHISMAGPSPTTSQALWPSFRVQLRLWPFDLSWGDGMNMKYMGGSINGGIQKFLVYFMENICRISYYITNIYIYMICLLSQCPYILPCVIEQYDVIINQFGSI